MEYGDRDWVVLVCVWIGGVAERVGSSVERELYWRLKISHFQNAIMLWNGE